MPKDIQLVVLGSIGIDDIQTPREERTSVLGGSLTYACAAASFYARTGMIGVIGDDFPDRFRERYRRFGLDTGGLEQAPGKTFHWSGAYEENLIDRRTLQTDLGVFELFSPEVPQAYRDAPFLLLGNIGPQLQLRVLDRMRAPKFVAIDTMDLWIETQRDALLEVVRRCDLLTLNDGEARLLTGRHGLRACAEELLALGPRWVVIKKGEHGSMLFSRAGIFLAPTFPVETVRDPTGAGDAFAGGCLGRLAQRGHVDDAALREALVRGSVLASFGVEAFSIERLESLRADDVDARLNQLRSMVAFDLEPGPIQPILDT